MSADREGSKAKKSIATGRRRGRRGGSPLRADAPTGPTPVAIIERVGQAITVRPPFEEALGGLETSLYVAAALPSLGFRVVPWREPLFEVEETVAGPAAVMAAGLEPVARGLLEKAGITVVVEGRAVRPLSAPELAAGTPRAIDPALLDFVRGPERGLIRIGPGVSPEWLVAGLRLAFPGAGIAVGATRHNDVRRFGRRLKEIIPGACWSLGDDFPADPGPLVVTTYTSLADHGVAIDRRDILVCLDAREALGRVASRAIGHADRARLFGLIRSGVRLAPYDMDRLRARFGFDGIEIPRHGHVARPVEVFTARIVGGPPTNCADTVSLKRRGVWAHPIRNRRVARLAAALTGGGGELVAEHPALAARLGEVLPRLVVLVEGIEHATALARTLPGWPIVPGSDLETGALPKEMARLVDASRWVGRECPARAIATLAGLGRVDLEHVALVLRAAGGLKVPDALAGGLSIPHPGGRPLLLVDLDDRHHPWLRRRSRGRREAYLALGWTVDGVARPSSPLDLFPAARPGLSR
jgi:hypothetical protein